MSRTPVSFWCQGWKTFFKSLSLTREQVKPEYYALGETFQASLIFVDIWWSIVLCEWLWRHQIKWRILGPPFLIDSSVYPITLCYSGVKFPNSRFQNPHHFQILPTLLLSLCQSIALCLPLRHFCHTPHFILLVVVSHKYSDGLMRRYHCNKLIEHKQMFHLVITQNR